MPLVNMWTYPRRNALLTSASSINSAVVPGRSKVWILILRWTFTAAQCYLCLQGPTLCVPLLSTFLYRLVEPDSPRKGIKGRFLGRWAPSLDLTFAALLWKALGNQGDRSFCSLQKWNYYCMARGLGRLNVKNSGNKQQETLNFLLSLKKKKNRRPPTSRPSAATAAKGCETRASVFVVCER